jgi:hypothetical protein
VRRRPVRECSAFYFTVAPTRDLLSVGITALKPRASFEIAFSGFAKDC